MGIKYNHILMRPLVSKVLMNIILNKDKEVSIYSLTKKVYGGKPKSTAMIFEARNLLLKEGFIKEYRKIIDGRLITILKPDFVNILSSLNEILFVEGRFSIGEIKQLAVIFDETNFNMFVDNLNVIDFFANLFHILHSFADLPDDFLSKFYSKNFCELISKIKRLDNITIRKFREVKIHTLALLSFDLIERLKYLYQNEK
jgi:hypothetical protein